MQRLFVSTVTVRSSSAGRSFAKQNIGFISEALCLLQKKLQFTGIGQVLWGRDAFFPGKNSTAKKSGLPHHRLLIPPHNAA